MSSHGRSLDILTKRRIRELVNSAAGPDDEVKFVLQNANGWAFVALQDRVVIARAGMAAGATFGGRVSQFLCQDIINVAQNMGMMTAVIEIHTPAHQGNAVGDFWTGLTSTGGTSKSPFEADNAFPCNRADEGVAAVSRGAQRLHPPSTHPGDTAPPPLRMGSVIIWRSLRSCTRPGRCPTPSSKPPKPAC